MAQNANDFPTGFTKLRYVYCNGSHPYIRVNDVPNVPVYLHFRVKQDTGYPEEQGFFGVPYYTEMYYEGSTIKAWGYPPAKIQLISATYGEIDDCVAKISAWSYHGYFFLGQYRDHAYTYVGKIYGSTITDDYGAVMYNFVPCVRDSDGSVGFMDLVSKNFYGSANADKFIAGY